MAFEDAEGLEAGKTRVKYRDVDVGLVDQVALSDDLAHRGRFLTLIVAWRPT